MKKYKIDVSRIPFSIFSTFDDPDEQSDTFNKLSLIAVDEDALQKRVKMTRPPAP